MWFLCPKRGVIRVWCSVLQNFANCSFLFSFLDRVQRLVSSFAFCESWARQTKRSSILYLSCWIKLFSSCFGNWAWTQIDFYFSISSIIPFPYQFSCEFLSVCTFRNKSSGGWDCPLLFIGGNDGEELAGSVGLLILSSGFVPYLLWGWRKGGELSPDAHLFSGAEIWPALCFSSQALRPWCVIFVLRALCCCDLEILKFCHVICYFERSAFCCCC